MDEGQLKLDLYISTTSSCANDNSNMMLIDRVIPSHRDDITDG